jgi:hypothetical protein
LLTTHPQAKLKHELNNLGYSITALGEYDEAEPCFKEALQISFFKTNYDRYYQNDSLKSVLGIANIMGKRGQREHAVELMSLVLSSPILFAGLTALATQFLGDLQTELPLDVFAAAQERGKALDVNGVIAELLANLDQISKDNA